MVNVASISLSLAFVFLINALTLSAMSVVPWVEAQRQTAVMLIFTLCAVLTTFGAISWLFRRRIRWFSNHWIVRYYLGIATLVACASLALVLG